MWPAPPTPSIASPPAFPRWPVPQHRMPTCTPPSGLAAPKARARFWISIRAWKSRIAARRAVATVLQGAIHHRPQLLSRRRRCLLRPARGAAQGWTVPPASHSTHYLPAMAAESGPAGAAGGAPPCRRRPGAVAARGEACGSRRQERSGRALAQRRCRRPKPRRELGRRGRGRRPWHHRGRWRCCSGFDPTLSLAAITSTAAAGRLLLAGRWAGRTKAAHQGCSAATQKIRTRAREPPFFQLGQWGLRPAAARLWPSPPLLQPSRHRPARTRRLRGAGQRQWRSTGPAPAPAAAAARRSGLLLQRTPKMRRKCGADGQGKQALSLASPQTPIAKFEVIARGSCGGPGTCSYREVGRILWTCRSAAPERPEGCCIKERSCTAAALWQRAAEPLWMYWKAALEAMDGGRNRDLLPLCRGRRPQQAVAECSRCS